MLALLHNAMGFAADKASDMVSDKAADLKASAQPEPEARAALHPTRVCTDAGPTWHACKADLTGIRNGTQWWYEHIYPHISADQKAYYQEPFGGAIQPTLYPQESRGALTSNESDAGIRFFMGTGGRIAGTRAPIHRHPFGAMTYVQQGYVTLFLEGAAPVTKGPGEAYYMPPFLSMSAAVMPHPVHMGKAVQQVAMTMAVDATVRPTEGVSTQFVEIEPMENGSWFDWHNGMWQRCEEAPRWACQV